MYKIPIIYNEINKVLLVFLENVGDFLHFELDKSEGKGVGECEYESNNIIMSLRLA